LDLRASAARLGAVPAAAEECNALCTALELLFTRLPEGVALSRQFPGACASVARRYAVGRMLLRAAALAAGARMVALISFLVPNAAGLTLAPWW